MTIKTTYDHIAEDLWSVGIERPCAVAIADAVNCLTDYYTQITLMTEEANVPVLIITSVGALDYDIEVVE